MNYLNREENPILFWFGKIGDFCILSVIWILLCLPIITFVPASIALFDSVAHCIQGTEDGPVRRFFSTLKAELFRGILISLIYLIIGFGLLYGYNILFQLGKENPTMVTFSYIYLLSIPIPLRILAWLIPVESRFQHSLLGHFRAAAVYTISHLPTTVMLLIILILAVLLTLLAPVLALVMPAIAVTVQCWFVERVFKKYIPQEEDTDE